MGKSVDGAFVAVGEMEQFLPRVGRVVRMHGAAVAVFRTEGGWYALEDRSPHPKGGPLSEGIVSGHYLYDPLYDWKIDLRDGRVQAPDTGQVKTYPIKAEDGIVKIAAGGASRDGSADNM